MSAASTHFDYLKYQLGPYLSELDRQIAELQEKRSHIVLALEHCVKCSNICVENNISI